jgi:hypothetical protein
LVSQNLRGLYGFFPINEDGKPAREGLQGFRKFWEREVNRAEEVAAGISLRVPHIQKEVKRGKKILSQSLVGQSWPHITAKTKPDPRLLRIVGADGYGLENPLPSVAAGVKTNLDRKGFPGS